ncbi:MAG: tRNA (N6-isopentenyl adenosine(37)-C2)-methylthiotransferase MiaB [Candidatus Azosocius agrarius]|nr:MAG: tRNA (N6-isopentenyl adenosine(37)-C2)-methylthiotransferase MiaB [Gammaproteobacteria bacterium]
MKRLFIKTLGCQMNEYDTFKIYNMLNITHNLQLTNNTNNANILILNTCSIRNKSQEKAFSEILKWKQIKNINKNIIIIITGCLAVQEGNILHKKFPFINIIVGPQTIHKIPELLNRVILDYNNKNLFIDLLFSKKEKFNYIPLQEKNISNYISISEGCNRYCTYCIVPYTRGKEIHREFNNIMTEILILSKRKIKEIILLGQNVNNYNGTINNIYKANLSLIIYYINEIKHIKRIKFITSHPSSLSNKIIQLFSKINKLNNNLHLPIQSGSNKILNLMKRGYKEEDYKKKILTLKKIRKNITISTDIIVGFPEETHQDFLHTINVIHNIKFDKSYSFLYSKRLNTTASKKKDNINLFEKKERLNIIQTLLNKYTSIISKQMIKNTYNTLYLGKSKNNKYIETKTENNRIIKIINNTNKIKNTIKIMIIKSKNNLLKGKKLIQ